MSARIAYVGVDRQLYIIDPSGDGVLQLTFDFAADPLVRWGQPDLASGAFSWPTWSPDGQRLACLEFPAEEGSPHPARLHVLDVDGVRQVVQLELSGRVPLYICWQPEGKGVAVLCQDEEQLELLYSPLDTPGFARPIEAGMPLFFAWADDGRRVVVHTGGHDRASSARLVARDSLGLLPDEILPQRPGDYCAPIAAGHRLVHVQRVASVNRLLSTSTLGNRPLDLVEYSGLGAIVLGSPPYEVLFSVAPAGQGTPYRGVTRFDARTGASRRMSDEDCLAFFWSEMGQQLVFVQVDKRDNCLVWKAVRVGESPSELCRFWPSREMLYFLHFFDQFSQSHSLISSDGAYLVYAGHELDSPRDSTRSRVMVKELFTPAPPRTIALGSFACFSHA